jgi:porphobilinogen synthase
MGFPQTRLRRLRSTPSIRRMLAAPALPPARLIYPVFLVDGAKRREPIASMAGQARVSIDLLERELAPAAEAGVGGFLFFGVPEDKDPQGSGACRDDSLVAQALRVTRQAYPDQVLFTDVCLCEYTDHGHCGIIRGDELDNDLSIAALGTMAVAHAAAGAHVVAPSAMMDGQVAAIRKALDAAKFKNTLILSYSTKFASALYGPFREAAKSAPAFGDRRGYQAPYDDLNQALRESLEDEAEGADMLMVKPALPYLDVVHAVKLEYPEMPLAAYNVSGEYSMIKAAAANGWLDEARVTLETLTAIKRAGADVIITYHALEASKWLK